MVGLRRNLTLKASPTGASQYLA